MTEYRVVFSRQAQRDAKKLARSKLKKSAQKLIDLCDLSLEIPQWGTKHSMNISVSVGMVLWNLKKIFLLK